jgi:hypothetical protein
MKIPKIGLCGLALAFSSAAAMAQGHDHEHEDIIIGHKSSGQLAAEFEWDEVHELPAVSNLLNGWFGDEPGFAALEADEPAEDFFVLEPGASIWLEVVDFDPAFYGNPLTDALHAPGEQVLLGDHATHEHVDWFIDADDPAYDPIQDVWEADFKLVDTGATSYTASEVYTLRFTVPEPGTLLLAAFGGVAVLLRRRTAANET